MKRVAVIGCALLGVAALAGGCGSSHNATSSYGATSLPGLTPTKSARLEAIVRRAAKVDGDAHPSSVMVYATSRHEANIAGGAGSGVPGSQPVYLVILRGHFNCNACSSPTNHPPPGGTHVMMVVDRRTLQDLDGGVGSGPLDTATVGPGLSLQLDHA